MVELDNGPDDAYRCTVQCSCTRWGPSDENGDSRCTVLLNEVGVLLFGGRCEDYQESDPCSPARLAILFATASIRIAIDG